MCNGSGGTRQRRMCTVMTEGCLHELRHALVLSTCACWHRGLLWLQSLAYSSVHSAAISEVQGPTMGTQTCLKAGSPREDMKVDLSRGICWSCPWSATTAEREEQWTGMLT